MKTRNAFLQICGLTLLSLGNANAASIIGGTGTGTLADPFILGSGPITISGTPAVTSGGWHDEVYFNFQSDGDYLMTFGSLTAPAGTDFGRKDPYPGGAIYVGGVAFDPANPPEIRGYIQSDDNGVGTFANTATEFPPLILPKTTSGYLFSWDGGSASAGSTAYTFNFSAPAVSNVPLPSVAWLMLSGIMGIFGLSKARKNGSLLPA